MCYNGKRIHGIGFNNNNVILIIDSKGIGKEYFNNGKLKFSGEYLKGKRWNRKGNDFNGNEIYEIKFGKGKIKEYNDDEQLIFEGEYLNGEI